MPYGKRRRAGAIEGGGGYAKLDGAAEIGERLLAVVLRHIDLGALGKGECIAAVALDRLIEIGNGAGIVLLAGPRDAADRERIAATLR